MAKQLLSAGLLMTLFGAPTPLLAQPTLDRQLGGSESSRTVDRRVAVDSGKSARVGVYTNIKRNCRSGPLPVITLTEPPHDGRLVVKPAKIRVSVGAACPSAEVPGLVARYQSRPGFSGADKVTIEIKRPDDGAISSQTITIDVKRAIQTLRSGTTNVNPTAVPQPLNGVPTEAQDTSSSIQTAVPDVPNTAEMPTENSSNHALPANSNPPTATGLGISVDSTQPDYPNAATEIPH